MCVSNFKIHVMGAPIGLDYDVSEVIKNNYNIWSPFGKRRD